MSVYDYYYIESPYGNMTPYLDYKISKRSKDYEFEFIPDTR